MLSKELRIPQFQHKFSKFNWFAKIIKQKSPHIGAIVLLYIGILPLNLIVRVW